MWHRYLAMRTWPRSAHMNESRWLLIEKGKSVICPIITVGYVVIARDIAHVWNGEIFMHGKVDEFILRKL